jgi:hypothetical protein
MIAEVTPAQGALYAGGAFVELVGIGLLAAPDLVPGARRLSRWIAPRWRTFENRVRRLLRLRGRNVVVTVGGAGSLGLAGSVSAVTSVSEDATLERKVDFLLRRDQEAQKQANAQAERIATLERESEKKLAELREQMETHVSTELATAAAEYRPARIIDAVAVAVGLGLATTGNFIG